MWALKESWLLAPLGGYSSGWIHPTGLVGMQCCMWPKDGSTALPQSHSAEGPQEGPRKGPCPLSSKALGEDYSWASGKV